MAYVHRDSGKNIFFKDEISFHYCKIDHLLYNVVHTPKKTFLAIIEEEKYSKELVFIEGVENEGRINMPSVPYTYSAVTNAEGQIQFINMDRAAEGEDSTVITFIDSNGTRMSFNSDYYDQLITQNTNPVISWTTTTNNSRSQVFDLKSEKRYFKIPKREKLKKLTRFDIMDI
jgi:hypothetical protein